MTNRKSHVGFQLIPKLATLNGVMTATVRYLCCSWACFLCGILLYNDYSCIYQRLMEV